MKDLKILTLNCQRGCQSNIRDFFEKILKEEEYSFLLLQEMDSKMEQIIKDISSSYKTLNTFDINLNKNSEVCILYKNNYELKESFFHSFAKFDNKRNPHGWGFIGGVFNIDGLNVVICSLHLTSGLKSSIRIAEIKIIKEKIYKYLGQNAQIIIAGDFNSGVPGEISKTEKILSPELVRINKNLGPTLDSRYTEASKNITNQIATFLAKFNIGIKLKTDHCYISKSTIKNQNFFCTILPYRISDHASIEIKNYPEH